MKKKQKKWIHPRHTVIRNIMYPFIMLWMKLKYHITIEHFKNPEKRNYLILCNHQTPMDELFVSLAFPKHVYYIATEDIFSNGFISKLLTWSVAPIPFKKTSADLNALKISARVAKEGGTICLYPEGNRTYSGKTEYMKPSVAKLVKALRLPVLICRIEGGFGTQPRFADSVRKGRMRLRFTKVMEPEEYLKLSDAELAEAVGKELFTDDTALVKELGTFRSEDTAEYMERCVYICPDCGFSEFESSGKTIKCKKCGISAEYGFDLKFTGDLGFTYVKDWLKYQNDYINRLDPETLSGEPLYTDTVNLSEVIPYKSKQILKENTDMCLYKNRLEFADGESFAFSDIKGMSVMGRNKLNFSVGEKIYQIRGAKRFNPVKIINLYYRVKHILEGTPDDTFLGL